MNSFIGIQSHPENLWLTIPEKESKSANAAIKMLEFFSKSKLVFNGLSKIFLNFTNKF
jgi:hypothetical protein